MVAHGDLLSGTMTLTGMMILNSKFEPFKHVRGLRFYAPLQENGGHGDNLTLIRMMILNSSYEHFSMLGSKI